MAGYKLTEETKDDLIRIHQWGVENHGEEAADKYYSAFFDRFEQLAENPYSFQSVTDIREGYRRSPCGIDSIYYRVTDKAVEIMGIVGNQDVDDWL